MYDIFQKWLCSVWYFQARKAWISAISRKYEEFSCIKQNWKVRQIDLLFNIKHSIQKLYQLNKLGEVMNDKFIWLKFSEFDFLRYQLRNWKKKKKKSKFSVNIIDIYLKQNTVFLLINFCGLILYRKYKLKNQAACDFERKPGPHCFDNTMFSYDWKLPSLLFLSETNQPHCILMALHFQKKALRGFFQTA